TNMGTSGLLKPQETISAFSTPPHTLLLKLPFQLLPVIHMALCIMLQLIRSGLQKMATQCLGASQLQQLEPLRSKNILLVQQRHICLPSMLRGTFGTVRARQMLLASIALLP